ncbi:MAG: beta-lactamase family protein [Bacteroidales bacterium]|nr:beta-lactamase family protein [Bacteroidales bacterium]
MKLARNLAMATAVAMLAVACSGDKGQGVQIDEQGIREMAEAAAIPAMQVSVYDELNGIRSFAYACYEAHDCNDCRAGDRNSCCSQAAGSRERGITGAEVAGGEQVFQAASLGKPLFSYIVMRLVDEGKMALDAPVASYTDVDRFIDQEMARRITVRMVLSHRTGLYNWAYSPTRAEWDSSPISFHFPAGECFGYSGEAYAFLQRAVEAVCGKSLDEVAREYVFEPFGMPLSSYGWRSEYDSLAVCGFDRDGISHGLWEGISPNCAYTLRTTSAEYMSFMVNAILKGNGLSPEAHREWLEPCVHAIRFAGRDRDCDADKYWCLGMGVRVEGNLPSAKQYWHWGDNDYWKSLYVVDPERGVAMNYFTNSAAGHDICDAMCLSLLGESYGIQDWIGGEDDL